jgi:hypothetical protein
MPDSNNVSIVTIIVAVVGAGGLGAFFRELVSGLSRISRGVAAKESKRKIDLVQQRDRALEREELWRHKADAADRNRRKSDEYAAEMRLALINNGVAISDLPKRPVYEDTLSRAEFNEIINKER